MEENDYRFLVTDERWLRVSNLSPISWRRISRSLRPIARRRSNTPKMRHSKSRMVFGHPLLVDGDDSDCNRESEKDEDLIPACLLSAHLTLQTRILWFHVAGKLWRNFAQEVNHTYSSIVVEQSHRLVQREVRVFRRHRHNCYESSRMPRIAEGNDDVIRVGMWQGFPVLEMFS